MRFVREHLKDCRRIVVKVGTSTITYPNGRLNLKRVEELALRMTAEDFGSYTKRYPSVFFRLGVARTDGPTGGLHTSVFNPDERALDYGVATMAALALELGH